MADTAWKAAVVSCDGQRDGGQPVRLPPLHHGPGPPAGQSCSLGSTADTVRRLWTAQGVYVCIISNAFYRYFVVLSMSGQFKN